MKLLRRQQRGAALLAMLAVLVMGASWWLVSALSAPVNRTALQRSHNAEVLQQAKQALIGWAALQAIKDTEENPGRLPCPEAAANIGNPSFEGTASGNCTLPAVGRLPWRTLGLDKLQDAAGEPLWYVVSPGWALPFSTAIIGINSNARGNLAVDGQPNAAVALIIAPGAPLTLAPNALQLAAGCVARNQARTPSAPNPLDYLECQNIAGASLRTSVVDNATNPLFNDQVLAVTAAEVLSAVEGPIAARIKREVVPQLQTVYNTSTWGASPTDPIYPFAVTFGDPASSDFKGVVGELQGLIPLTAATCTALTAGHCDPNFVQWNTGAISVVKRGGDADITSVNCATSTGSQVSCSISYSATCGGGLGSILGGSCTVTLEASVLASAQNIGRAMRTFDPAGISGFTLLVSTSTPIVSTGAANADVRGQLPPASCNLLIILGLLFPCTASNTATVTVPIAVFADHPLLIPAPTDPWYWFIANKWYDVTYYAVAPSHAPSGALHNCQTVADCIAVSGGTPPTNVRATLALAGRSLAGTVGSNRALTDFLDTAENQNVDRNFEQNKVSRNFNDRFVTVSNY
jgi:hypothetical protein